MSYKSCSTCRYITYSADYCNEHYKRDMSCWAKPFKKVATK